MSTDRAEPQNDEPRKRIALAGPRVDAGAQRLLSAVEHAFPVRFEQLEGAASSIGVDGVLAFDEVPPRATAGRLPHLILPSHAPTVERETMVQLSADRGLPRPLQGRAVREQVAVGPPPFSVPDGADVLAETDDSAVWWQHGDGASSLCMSSYPLSEMTGHDALIEHLCSGRFMGLLPLVHFLGRVLAGEGWTPPPLRACFLIDDPNLHWTSYGFLNYRELIGHAKVHGYHIAFATVPLDSWLVNGRAAGLLRDNRSSLSLLMHGNDHVARELGRLSTDEAADGSIARGLLRIEALENRAGVTVDRVMAPPHGACSEHALGAMFRLGMEAACVSRPYPWRDGLPPPTPLAGWRPAEMVAGGLPVLPRYFLGLPRDDLAFRALLGQPLILYGHHGDFASGLDLLAEAAAEINGLGDAEWIPVGQIARNNYATRRVGDILHVRLYSRRAELEVPDGIRELRIGVQEPIGGAAGHRLLHRGAVAELVFAGGLGTSAIETGAGPARVELSLAADGPLDPRAVARRGVRPWPLIRRLAVEGRDRIQPLLARS
jgi:hypothetical protein